MVLALALLAAAGWERHEAVEPHMGTLVRVVVYAETEEKAHAGLRAAYARVAALDQTLSDYRQDSELNQLGTEPRQVSRDLWRVVEFGQRLAEATGGAFDLTLGARTRAWRAGEAPQGAWGWRHLRLDRARRTVWFDKPGIRLDLGGIAKGYAAQEALAVLERNGLSRAMVAVGGDIVVGDSPPDEDGWRLKTSARPQLFTLVRRAVSTSGDTEQYKDTGSHIHDGRTGRPVHGKRVVSVIALDGMTADALATAVRLLPREEYLRVAAQFGAWVVVSPAGGR